MPAISGLTLIFVFGGALTVLFLALVSIFVYVVLRPRLRLQKRMAAIGVVPDGKGVQVAGRADSRRQKRIQDKVKSLADKKTKKGGIGKIKTDLLQAGVNIDMVYYFIGSFVIGVGFTALYIFIGLPPIGAFPAFLFGLLGLPKLVLKYLAKRRQKDFTSHFAEAIDVIVRGIRSGLPVSECLNIIAREFPGPLGEEFNYIIEGQNLGLSLDDIMDRGLERIPTTEFKFFAIVLQIQKQTGGNLADTLENLSNVLRERKKMKDKVQALSSEAKSSAMIIASLPFFVAGMLAIINPTYIGYLLFDPIGHWLMGIGAFWMLTGITVMSKMINFDF
ncbi:MAG: type II secretion system F family protein [Rhodospirillaceae bacterium]|jgi:tight adherence protein B|nr:type II secretion system F family protein [Rhodospirillaceae bacterium]MBT5751808.1 type II secretion system F family protein [Rhodospirillaceae bacterium]